MLEERLVEDARARIGRRYGRNLVRSAKMNKNERGGLTRLEALNRALSPELRGCPPPPNFRLPQPCHLDGRVNPAKFLKKYANAV